MVTYPPFARKLIAVGLLLAISAGVYAAVVQPYLSHVSNLQDQIVQQSMLLERLKTFAAEKDRLPTLDKQIEALRTSPDFVTGGSEALITATLQQRIAIIAEEVGTKVRSTRALTAREHNGLKLLGIQIQLTASLQQIQEILYEIEKSRPLLFVETLHLTASKDRSADENVDQLNARLDVFAAVASGRS